MRRIKIFFIKLYYYFICLLTDKIRVKLLLKHKLMLGAFLISLTLNSCSIFHHKAKQNVTCHFFVKTTSLNKKTKA